MSKDGMKRFMGPRELEGVMGWPAGSVSGIAWLVIQELSRHRPVEKVADGLDVEIEDLDDMIREITGEPEGHKGTSWQNAVIVVRSVEMMNHNTMATGWDAIEAMALNRLGDSLNAIGDKLDPMKALEIAQAANKAQRRHLGEGNRGASVSVRTGANGELSADVELPAGNLGSIRLSLSQRVRDQLGEAKTIDAKPNAERRMLSIEDTRSLLDGRD